MDTRIVVGTLQFAQGGKLFGIGVKVAMYRVLGICTLTVIYYRTGFSCPLPLYAMLSSQITVKPEWRKR